jgi:manganese catalase
VFYSDGKLQYTVRVDEPNPLFARQLQQAIGRHRRRDPRKECCRQGRRRPDPDTHAIVGGMFERHYLSAGMAAMPVDCDGVPFDMSHVYASGNPAADMYANVMAESTGRVLATRLYETTLDGEVPEGRWSHGRSLDGRGEFRTERAEPIGDEPEFSPPES